MGQESKLMRSMIDRMVTESIRRILPAVMNEVLLRTIADSGVLAEGRPIRHVRKKPGPKPKRRPLVEQRQTRLSKPTPLPKRKVELGDLLDDSAGSEFYQDPRSRQMPEQQEEEYEVDLEDDAAQTSAPVRELLNPTLRALAEDIEIPEDDDGGMWQPGEHDAAATAPGLSSIKDVNRAAATLGIDFSRMAGTIARTSPATKVDPEDVKNRATFEARRLRALRERLNDGKPVE